MFHRIATLIVKELQALLRDPNGRRLLVIPVVMQLLLFPAAATLEVRNNVLAILNEDEGRESLELIQRCAQAKAFKQTLVLHSQAELRSVIDEQRALVVLQFPADFSRKLIRGESPAAQAILDGRRSNSGQIALAYLQIIFQTYAAERSAVPRLAIGASNVAVRHWFNPNLKSLWFILPNLIATITTATSLIITSLSVAREREQGTFDQLLVSPLTPGMIMFGKAVPAMLVSMGQGTIVLVAGVFAYGIPFQGSLLLLYGSMIFYILALVGFGLSISSICSTQQQAFLGVFTFMMPAILLSGFTSPIDNMPPWLQYLTWADPLRHFLIITTGVFLKDMGFLAVASHVWPLLVIATVTLTIADLAFRRRLG